MSARCNCIVLHAWQACTLRLVFVARLPTGPADALLSADVLVAAATKDWLSKKDAGSWLDWGVANKLCTLLGSKGCTSSWGCLHC